MGIRPNRQRAATADISKLVVPYPYPLIGNKNIEGLASVISAEAERILSGATPVKEVIFVTADTSPTEQGGVKIISAEPDTSPQKDLSVSRRMWHIWCILHPQAFTAPSVPEPARKAMYRGVHYEKPEGSFERLVEHCSMYAPPPEWAATFLNRFKKGVIENADFATVNMQDFLWLLAVREWHNDLRQRKASLVSYLHTHIPDNLEQSEAGRALLSALSLLDRVYVHADEFKDNIERSLTALGLRVPEIRRFDLGIDKALLDKALEEINHSNYETVVSGLSERQRIFLREAFRSQQDPEVCRFFCIDRIDPIKGLDTVIQGVAKFLKERKERGEDINRRYRFFFVNLPVDPKLVNKVNLSGAYGVWLEKQLQGLEELFPGIIFRSEPFVGNGRKALYSAMRRAHIISGGRCEGLHLSFMEALYINRGLPFAGILPDGAGFAKHAIAKGYAHGVIFPKHSKADLFAESLASLADADRDNLAGFTEKLLNKLILPRKDSVLLG
ncbi:MAG: hypothetical protein D6780_00400 [Candidatus Dadabacteria bacterium]|nr:MAG: hypothetical protein D6780_00400 [Candidatus Dadabacteria bacterium]